MGLTSVGHAFDAPSSFDKKMRVAYPFMVHYIIMTPNLSRKTRVHVTTSTVNTKNRAAECRYHVEQQEHASARPREIVQG